jgi:hypothetical protein
MHDMKAVPVRELQREIRAILAEAWPDLAARARKVLGSRRVSPPPSRQIVAERGER